MEVKNPFFPQSGYNIKYINTTADTKAWSKIYWCIMHVLLHNWYLCVLASPLSEHYGQSSQDMKRLL